jgi:rhodanese-related sulfurtransferase
MQALARNQFWMVGALVLSCVWLYASQTAGTVPGSPAPIREVSTAEARELLDTRHTVVIDVREKEAFDRGHIPGAISVPLGELGTRMDNLGIVKTAPVLVYCGEGVSRGTEATRQLNAGGYEGAVNLKGGYNAWKIAGQPVAR